MKRVQEDGFVGFAWQEEKKIENRRKFIKGDLTELNCLRCLR